MKKRILSTLLAAMMLFSVTACGGDKDNEGNKPSNDTTVSTDGTLPAGIEKQDYKGVVNILIPEWGIYTNYFDPGDDLTDVMNKALFNREQKVESYLGVDITYEHTASISDISTLLATAISTNDDLYQIALNHCISGNSSNITNGYLLDMNEMDIDFTGEWFNHKSNEALEVGGMQFYCISDYMLPDPNVVLFNKKLIEENQLEDPYQLVRDGKWTIDKLAEMASAITSDNGDTVWDENDTYGFSNPGEWLNNSFIYSSDIPFVEKNDDGEFYLAFDNERAYTLMEKLDELINGPDTFTTVRGEDSSITAEITMDSNRCLFTLFALNQLYTIRNIEVDFGILPYPKLDEEQEDYISNDWTGLLSVPMSLSEDSYEMVGDVIELLAYYSAEEVIPTYIDDTLGTKLSRDDESKEMINLVFDSCTFNAGMNYFGFSRSADNTGINRLFYTVSSMLIAQGENTFASWLATNVPAAEVALEEFNTAVRELAE